MITECTPLTKTFKISRLNPFNLRLFYQPHGATNLMQPGGASVQGEDVTQRGVCRFLHGGGWHITNSYACWTRKQIRIGNSF